MSNIIPILWFIYGALTPAPCPTVQPWTWVPDAHVWACHTPKAHGR